MSGEATDSVPRTWAGYSWPDWVPAKVRKQVEDFWSGSWGRGPHSWARDMREQGSPALGAIVTLPNGFGEDAPDITGRYVHAWNNVGRLVLDDGTFAYTSFSRSAVAEPAPAVVKAGDPE